MKSNLVDIACIVRSETDRAICVEHCVGKPVWLPKSQVEIEENPDGKTVTVSMPEWLATERGIV